MSHSLLYKILVLCVLFLFFGSAFNPYMCVISKSIDEEVFFQLGTIQDDVEKSVTCYVFDKNGNSEHEVALSSDEFERFYSLFEELNHKITYSPFSSETEVLKSDFVDLLDDLEFIPEDSSKEDITRLMNPSIDHHRRPLLSLMFNPVLKGRGYAFFCNYATFGEGSQFPVLIFPRLIPILLVPIPRVIMHWNAYYAITSCGGLLSGKGFIAEGAQQGTAIGFWGIGFSVFLPPVMSFGFIGYALFSTATAENIIPWPPNRPPVVLGEDPPDGTIDVPLSISELNFHLSDYDGDRMNYTVTTSPYIGSGSGNNVKDGDFSFDIFGLESNTEYTWSIVVSDGEDTVEEEFSFHTEIEAPIVSDPLPVDGDSWVSVELSELSFRVYDMQGDLMDFSVETVPDIGSGSGSGVGNGVYSVPVSDLEYTRDYTWFVNVTDGKYWVRKAFVFKTQPIMVFDPFEQGWLYRKQITINHSQVAGDLSSFPVLVSMVDSDLAVKAQVDGDDVLFMDGSGVAGRLFHEVELFDGSSGELVCWVNVPSVSDGEDTVLFLYYGNSGCGSQEYADLVWDSDYIAVHHMNDATPSIVYDSTSNFNTGYKYAADDPKESEQGIIENCQQHNTNNNYIRMEDDFSLDIGARDATMEIWFKTTSESFEQFYYSDDPNDYNKLSFLMVEDDCVGQVFVRGNTYSDTSSIRGSKILNDGGWHYIVGTVDNSQAGHNDDLRLFVDGDEETLSKETHDWDGTTLTNSRDNWIGKRKNVNKPFQGYLDEFRLSKYERSDVWIRTSYNTVIDPSSFFSVGPEEMSP